MTYDHWKTTEPDDGAERHLEIYHEPTRSRPTRNVLIKRALEAARSRRAFSYNNELQLAYALEAAESRVRWLEGQLAALKGERND